MLLSLFWAVQGSLLSWCFLQLKSTDPAARGRAADLLEQCECRPRRPTPARAQGCLGLAALIGASCAECPEGFLSRVADESVSGWWFLPHLGFCGLSFCPECCECVVCPALPPWGPLSHSR